MEKYEQIQERLRNSESEIRTLKTFLTTKTALIEKYKKDLRENKMRVAELEEKDERRTVILADVLEKTARQYQQQLGKTSAMGGLSPRGKRRQPKPKPPELHEEEPRSEKNKNIATHTNGLLILRAFCNVIYVPVHHPTARLCVCHISQ